MNQIEKQRENLGLAAILVIINSIGRGKKISNKAIQKAQRILKEFNKIENHKFKPRGNYYSKGRWAVQKKGCDRLPNCHNKCSHD